MSRGPAESAIRCQITAEIFFDPVIAVSNDDEQCGHCFEKEAIKLWMKRQQERGSTAKCPTCRAEIASLVPALDKRDELEKAFSENPTLYNEVYFDLAHFQKIFEETKDFNKAIFRHYTALLEKADQHLNTVIHVLASTLPGRDLLRKKLTIEAESGKYFFGKAGIFAESLQIQVNGKSIREWLLSMTTAMEVALDEEQKARQALNIEAQTALHQLQTQCCSQARLFLLRGARGAAAAAGHHIADDEINQTLQRVVYGEEGAVKDRLEALKNNPVKLFQLLSVTGTVLDYSNRTITGMTVLQAAAASGDIEMCLMLKNYMAPEEFVCQLAEIFPEGIEAHEIDQQRSAFNFDAIFAAIRAANTPDLDAALNKIDNGSALCRALEEFRRQFSAISNNEKIFNSQHLLRAFEVYNALWDQCERDGSDCDYKKRDLSWHQIIGYTQRFMPACYAQAFSQGLYYLVKADQLEQWRPEVFKRHLKLRCDNFFYFPLAANSRFALGFDFALHEAGGWDRRDFGLARWLSRARPACFKNFCQAKTSRFHNIISRERGCGFGAM